MRRAWVGWPGVLALVGCGGGGAPGSTTSAVAPAVKPAPAAVNPAPAPEVADAVPPGPHPACGAAAKIRVAPLFDGFDETDLTDGEPEVKPQLAERIRGVHLVFASSRSAASGQRPDDGELRVELTLRTDQPLVPGVAFYEIGLSMVGHDAFNAGRLSTTPGEWGYLAADVLEIDDAHVCVRLTGGDTNYTTFDGVVDLPWAR